MKTTWVAGGLVIMLFLAVVDTGFAQSGPPTPPPFPLLEDWPFADTNWLTSFGYAPLGFSNITTAPVWTDGALCLDTTNSAPAYLQYNVLESDGHTNLNLTGQTLMFWFSPNWAWYEPGRQVTNEPG